jgi:hypothetical protein
MASSKDEAVSLTTEPLTAVERQDYLLRALDIINVLAGEGVLVQGHEDPADLMMEIFERLGVEEVSDSWEATGAALREQVS